MKQNKYVIIAAGGTGSRLNANLPKQYMLLNGKPVLMHTIMKFVGIADRVIVALHPNMEEYWKELCLAHNFNIAHEIVYGGHTRFQTVRNAISHLKRFSSEEDYLHSCIAIHDAARPLVDTKLIEESFKLAQQGIANTLAVKSTNSIRVGNNNQSKSIDRDTVWQIQTPQTFPSNILDIAYQQEETPLFTDDCSVVEKTGQSIFLLESTNRNIKLTYSEDFKIAAIYLEDPI